MLRLLGVLLGIGLIGLGVLGIAFGILEIFDPADAKLADDNDPFGTPPSHWESTFKILVYLGVAIVGGAIIHRMSSDR